jgi:integrase
MQRRIRGEKRLKTKDLERLGPGIYEDGGGLRFKVEPSRNKKKPGARRWVLRLTINGKRRDRGLGPYPLVKLDSARDRATDMRRAAREGRDLTLERRQQAAKSKTFEQAFETFFESKRQSLSNGKHIEQWRSTIKTYVFPKIGDRPVSEITHAEIVDVLRPIWFEKPETAKRVLQRMAAVFKMAIRHEWREKASLCDGVKDDLGGTRHRKVKHHRALPYAEVPKFIKMLRASSSEPVTKLAFEWLTLTATRSGETRGAAWPEVDEVKAEWSIPEHRMKKPREHHVVPLSDRCLEIAKQARALNPDAALLFPSELTGKQLSDMTFTKLLRDIGLAERATAHGFRSSFTDWAAEVDKCREAVVEAALSHKIKDKTEAAYRRAPYLEERARLMQRWANYCA